MRRNTSGLSPRQLLPFTPLVVGLLLVIVFPAGARAGSALGQLCESANANGSCPTFNVPTPTPIPMPSARSVVPRTVVPRTPIPRVGGGGAFGGIGRGRILVLLERTDYWQSGLVFPKGQYQQLHAKGIAAIRQEIGEIDPRFARNAEALTDWRQVSLLSVESSRCPLWHKPGLLLIGDAAHVMSPVGGVGINYAIQDAVVTANVLTGPLKAGTVTNQHLAEVQRQREWPTKVIQAFQSFLQNRLIASVLLSQQVANVPWQLRLLTKIPILRDFPPRMIGFGLKRVRLKEV